MWSTASSPAGTTLRRPTCLLVEAVAGPRLTQVAYDAAVAGGYDWHEFGDSALLLPARAEAIAA